MKRLNPIAHQLQGLCRLPLPLLLVRAMLVRSRFINLVKKSTSCSNTRIEFARPHLNFNSSAISFDKKFDDASTMAENTTSNIFSGHQGDPATIKLAKWLDIGVIKHQGRVFDASKTLMSTIDEDAIIFPRYYATHIFNSKPTLSMPDKCYQQRQRVQFKSTGSRTFFKFRSPWCTCKNRMLFM